MSKVSIIVTTYKHQKFIEKTIESVLAQTYTNWELLIWDDSPDNNTWNIIQFYVNIYPNKIRAWHHDSNKWIVDNMNFLLSHVSPESEYISFLEGDDVYDANNINAKIKIFESQSNISIIYNNFSIIDKDNKVIRENWLWKTKTYFQNKAIDPKYLLQNTVYVSFSTLMIKNTFLKEIPNSLHKKNNIISDWDLFFRISSKYRVYWLSDILTLYRVHDDNISNTSGDNMIVQYLELNNIYLHQGLITKQLHNKRKWYLLHFLAYNNILCGNKIQATKVFVQSILLNPFLFIKSRIILILRLLLPTFINKKL